MRQIVKLWLWPIMLLVYGVIWVALRVRNLV